MKPRADRRPDLAKAPAAPLALQADKTPASGFLYWTGTTADGVTSAATCVDWPSKVGTDQGMVGLAGSTDIRWTNSGLASCATLQHYLCLER